MNASGRSHWKRVLVTAAVYIAAAWAAVEALVTVVDRFGLPQWWATLITALFVAGLPVTVFLVWRSAGEDRHAGATSIVGSLLFLIGATAGIYYFTQPESVEPASAVAVVPCEFEGDDEYAYRAEGLAEDVHARLSREGAVKISSWNSSLFVRERGYEPDRIAQVLHVDRLVQCRMRSSPERVELSAELIDPAADTVLWNRDYDFAMSDIGTVVTELTGALLDVLGSRVEASEMERVNDLGTFSPEAYDLYLQARALEKDIGGDRDAAEALIVQALAIDPNYAEALVFHADLLFGRAVSEEFEDFQEPKVYLEQARGLAQKALQLDPGVFHARRILAGVCGLLGDYFEERCPPGERERLEEEECEVRGDTAEGWACRHRLLARQGEDNKEALTRWLELEPTNWDGNMQYAAVLWFDEGQPPAALAVIDTMLALYPEDARSFGLISNALREEGRLDEVLAWRYGVFGDQVLEGPWQLARLGTDYLNLGLYEQAMEMGRKTWEVRRASAMHFLPMLWVRIGEPERAAEALDWNVETVGSQAWGPVAYAISIYLFLGDYQRAQELSNQIMADRNLAELCEKADWDGCLVQGALEFAHLARGLGDENKAAEWLRIAEEATGGEVPEANWSGIIQPDVRLGVMLRIAQGRREEAVEMLHTAVFDWKTDGQDLLFPLMVLEDDAVFDPLRDMPAFQQLLEDYDAALAPMRERVLEAERTGDWEQLRQRTYAWAAETADGDG